MLKFLIPLLLVLTFALPAVAELKLHDFFGTPFGSSRETVAKEFQAESYTDGRLIAKHKSGDRLSIFLFVFENNKLISVSTITESLQSTVEGNIAFCDNVAKNMTTEHGKPEVFVDPEIGPVLIWQNTDIEVQMACRLENPGMVVMVWQPIQKLPPIKTLSL